MYALGPPPPPPAAAAGRGDLGVRIEAQFTVGEYEVLVLSAQDSTGLDTWLHQNHYKIPEGAEPVLRPYVQSGMRFFVAKVDIKKVHFENGMHDRVENRLRRPAQRVVVLGRVRFPRRVASRHGAGDLAIAMPRAA